MRGIGKAWRAIAGLVLPPRCPGCGAVTAADHQFCATCFAALRFLGPPWCARCAVPFAHDRGPEGVCADCHFDPPAHHGARAAVAYGDIARALALRLKYGGRIALATTAARLMARLLPGDAALLVPVPLHRWRLWSRGFNQAALLADALGCDAGLPTDPFVLTRPRRTPSLRGLTREQRARAVRAAFATDPQRRGKLKGKHIVLIDDVYTTGATADACARTLLKGGAARVTVLCWARVLDEGGGSAPH